jgi:hypothetical protein
VVLLEAGGEREHSWNDRTAVYVKTHKTSFCMHIVWSCWQPSRCPIFETAQKFVIQQRRSQSSRLSQQNADELLMLSPSSRFLNNDVRIREWAEVKHNLTFAQVLNSYCSEYACRVWGFTKNRFQWELWEDTLKRLEAAWRCQSEPILSEATRQRWFSPLKYGSNGIAASA